MKVINQVHPIPAQAQAFCNDPDDSPFVMINLLKFKDQAEYPDGSDAQLSGREAYLRYGMAVRAHIERVGGKPLFGQDRFDQMKWRIRQKGSG